MRYFKYETNDRKVNVYPIVCWHLGSPQSDSEFIDELIARIQNDDHARWIYLGDGGECVTKQSKGDVYGQTLSPQAQKDEFVRRLGPIRGRGLFGVRGNHGNRIYKETGFDFDKNVCDSLEIPYAGTAAFGHVRVRSNSEHPAIFSIYAHHGVDSGVSIASKVTRAQQFDRTVIADAILTAHSHIALELPPRYYTTLAPRGAEPILWNATHEYICGSAYDSRTGYAEDKGYSPLLPSTIVITFETNSSGHKIQRSEIIRKELK